MSLNEIRASKGWMLCLMALLSLGSAFAQSGSPSQPGNSADQAFAGVTLTGERGGPVLNQNTGMSYGSIQAAVTAASAGNTLVVQANIVEGQVNIDKNLTLTSAGGITVSAGVDTTDVGDNRGWFLVDSGVSLTVSNLAFDGTGQAIFQAFRHKGTGSFTNCSFSNIFYPSGGGTEAGFAIVSFDEGASAGLTVSDSDFSEYGKVGVLAFGDTTVTCTNNTFTGRGADMNNVNYGIEAGGGASVSADENIFTDHTAVEGSAGSAGILSSTAFGAGTSLDAQSNWFTDNTSGILTPTGDGSAVTANFNTFFGNGNGMRMGSAANAENNWWGCNGGPGAGTCDSIAGTGSVDANPWLVLTVTAGDSMLIFGESTTISADLRFNSDGINTSGSGTVIDGLTASFDGGGLGTMTPLSSTTINGVATSTFSPLAFNQNGFVCATVSAMTACTPMETAVATIPTLGEWGMIAFIGLLAVAGIITVRRARING
jgi:hypothetical protein